MTFAELSSILPGHNALIDLVWTLGTAGVLVAIALGVHFAVVFVARRIARRTHTQSDDLLIAHLLRPLRWIMVALALLSLDRLPVPNRELAAWLVSFLRLAAPLLWGWLLIAGVRFMQSYVYARSDIEAEDNLAARRRRTRADILARIATLTVIIASVGLMLLSIPEVREIGVALMASAGIAGLAVGVAAQPLLKNIVGGFQLAFTEPVRIDDAIVYRGEWGRVERIGLTYVVLRIWDQRRLVIPVSKLIEEPIENWTRETSEVLGTVMIYTDHAADVGALRETALKAVRGHRLWDGRVANFQVTDMTPEALELRVLMSARGGSDLFDLRCDVREAVVRALAGEHPASLTRNRIWVEEERCAS
jgi:small-conductance mechanosensitive channel